MTFEEIKAKAQANKQSTDSFLAVNDVYCLFCYKPTEKMKSFHYYLVIPYIANPNHTQIKDLRTNKSFLTPQEDTLQEDYYTKKYKSILAHYGIIPDKDTKCFPMSFYRTVGQACKSGLVSDRYLKRAYSFNTEQFSSLHIRASDIVEVCDQITNHYYYIDSNKSNTTQKNDLTK